MEITDQQNITLVTAIIGAVCGMCGMVLGILNAWHQLNKTRLRLKVTPKIAFAINANNVMTVVKCDKDVHGRLRNGHSFRLCIEVINLSTFPLTVSEVGFDKVNGLRHILFSPELSPSKTSPVRLESRESVVAYAKAGAHLDSKRLNSALAYATTDCGTTRYGTSSVFKKYVRFLRSDVENR